jgi:hypothetical protein
MGDLIANWQQLFAVDVDAKAKVDGMDIDYHQQPRIRQRINGH